MSRLTRLLPIALLMVAAIGTVAGQDAVVQDSPGSTTLFQIIIGSWMSLILIVVSVIGVSVFIHRLITVKKEALVPDGLADDLHNIFAEGITDEGVEDAVNLVSNDGSMLGEVMAAAMDKRDFGYEAMKDAAESVGAAEHNKYMTQIGWLSLLAAIGPMLGLLGTVIGMIQAFMTMAATGGAVDPAGLADSIGSAMITTAQGLILAIPMIAAFFFLRTRVNRYSIEASVICSEVLDYFRPAR